MNSRPGLSFSNSISPQNGVLLSLSNKQLNAINNNQPPKVIEQEKLREPQIKGHEKPVHILSKPTP